MEIFFAKSLQWNKSHRKFNLVLTLFTTLLYTIFIIVHFKLSFWGGSEEEDRSSDKQKCRVNLAIILCQYESQNNFTRKSGPGAKRNENAVVANNFARQINQTIAMLKSIVIIERFRLPILNENSKEFHQKEESFLHENCINVYIISNKYSNFLRVKNIIYFEENWDNNFKQFLNLTFVPVIYPKDSIWMMEMFRPCATLRLFIHDILKSVDSVIYLDTDIIFLNSIHNLWRHFLKNKSAESESEKLAHMAPCLFHYGTEKNKVPFYGESGLNAGVFLFNLYLARSQGEWSKRIKKITSEYKYKLRLADQDILNIYFHFYPEELSLLTCDWNFRPWNCLKGSHCESMNLGDGISIMHGNALTFTPKGPDNLFYAVYSTFRNLQLKEDSSLMLLKSLITNLENNLRTVEDITNSDCKKYGGFSVLVLNRLESMLSMHNNEIKEQY